MYILSIYTHMMFFFKMGDLGRGVPREKNLGNSSAG